MATVPWSARNRAGTGPLWGEGLPWEESQEWRSSHLLWGAPSPQRRDAHSHVACAGAP